MILLQVPLSTFVAGSTIHHQYMAFSDVNLKRFLKIDALRERNTPLLRMRVLYDGIEQVMIVKLMPSLFHSLAAARLHDILHEKFITLGVKKQIFSVGDGRFGDPNERFKEPDIAYTTNERNHDDFPCFVVEVGVAESLQMLKCDAHFWLTKSDKRTKLVLIIHIDKVLRKILLQR
ncbi:hypothetical protein KC19_3G030300 [Ceratodon purpureus]|uniref:Uncharacterized protein n=1 Tax=Ceratodon purpureus TaxID=3225 RepID=A0A8T0IE79_CERPU|nr:hypothetical protein KC19_3G030300 [Ceratodon purpureus]